MSRRGKCDSGIRRRDTAGGVAVLCGIWNCEVLQPCLWSNLRLWNWLDWNLDRLGGADAATLKSGSREIQFTPLSSRDRTLATRAFWKPGSPECGNLPCEGVTLHFGYRSYGHLGGMVIQTDRP